MTAIASHSARSKDRATAVYKAAVARHFTFLKAAETYAEAILRGIELPNSKGRLVPLCEAHVGDVELIGTLAAWRETNGDAFPTRFQVTAAGTSRWLRAAVLDNPGRLTFLVVNRYGKPIGHLGLAGALNDEREVEIDNVVRGVAGADFGLMGEALDALLGWANEMLSPEMISLRVFKDNTHAVQFYERHGFAPDRDIPLKKVGSADVYSFEPAGAAAPDRIFLRMIHVPATSFEGDSLVLTAGPTISAIEASYSHDATTNGWNSQWSGYLTKFEREFADYIGVKHAMATSCGTGALHIALLALGVGPGDEVIVPDLTWVATGAAAVYCGATPVFAEVSEETWTLDPDKLEALISPHTKAIMPVHLYGHPAEMDRIMAIADKHGVRVVEDAAPAIGAECKGQKTGTYGAFSMFSFQGAKLAVTGEGGMLVTNDDALHERAHLLWDQGRVPGTFWINEIGWKYKMSNVQAAIGLAQLQRTDELIEAKRRIYEWYREELSGIEGLRLAAEADWARSIFWMTSITVDAGIDRDAVRKALRDRNVDTRPVFPAISTYPIWGRTVEPQPIAERIGRQSINLPSGHKLTRAKVRYIAKVLSETLRG